MTILTLIFDDISQTVVEELARGFQFSDRIQVGSPAEFLDESEISGIASICNALGISGKLCIVPSGSSREVYSDTSVDIDLRKPDGCIFDFLKLIIDNIGGTDECRIYLLFMSEWDEQDSIRVYAGNLSDLTCHININDGVDETRLLLPSGLYFIDSYRPSLFKIKNG